LYTSQLQQWWLAVRLPAGKPAQWPLVEEK
jgi:hypothetical protein